MCQFLYNAFLYDTMNIIKRTSLKGAVAMYNKKKALTSAIIFSVIGLIWLTVALLSLQILAGSAVLILIICAAISSLLSAVIWFVRYFGYDKPKNNKP